MKRLIPVLTAIVLIILILGVSFGLKLAERYSYSNKEADLNEYYGLTAQDQVAVVMSDKILDEKGILKNGECYLPYDMVCKYFVASRFYVNKNENSIRYVMPDRIISLNIGDTSYTDGNKKTSCEYAPAMYVNDTLYMAVDFVRLFSVFDHTVYTSPNRIQIDTSYEEHKTALLSKAAKVRIRGGIKSDILTSVSEGAKVTVLEEMGKWTKVKTADSFIGYVENSALGGKTNETPQFKDSTSTYGGAEYTSIHRDHKINMGWHQMAGAAGNASLASIIAETKSLNTISPTWFFLSDNNGGISSFASADYVQAAHAKGIEVWALVDDFTGNVDDNAILSSSANRAALISNLMGEVKKTGLDGINIDFEKVSEAAGPHYVEFIRELSVQCRAAKIVLSVDDYPPSGGTTWYNRAEQSVFADYIIVMGYDENNSAGNTAGSVSSISYVENGIKDTLKSVPASKLINAVPFYTRIWQTAGTKVSSQAVGMSDAKAFITNNHITTSWDEKTCQNYGEIQKDNTYYQVWLEDAASLKAKLGVMSNYNLAGVAEWKLGLETPDIWDELSAYVSK